jgi:preprotein translocase subunit YajC
MMTQEGTQEMIDSIRFFGSVVSTNGISADVKEIANAYLLRLIRAIEPAVTEATAKASGILT